MQSLAPSKPRGGKLLNPGFKAPTKAQLATIARKERAAKQQAAWRTKKFNTDYNSKLGPKYLFFGQVKDPGYGNTLVRQKPEYWKFKKQIAQQTRYWRQKYQPWTRPAKQTFKPRVHTVYQKKKATPKYQHFFNEDTGEWEFGFRAARPQRSWKQEKNMYCNGCGKQLIHCDC